MGKGASPGLIVKIIALATINGAAVWSLGTLIPEQVWLGVGFVVAAAIALNVIYLSRARSAIPLKYLAPGTLFLLVFQVYPVLYTAVISTTNLGTGNILDKTEAIEQIRSSSRRSTPSEVEFGVAPARNPDGDLALLLTRPNESDPEGSPTVFFGTSEEFTEVADATFDDRGRVTAVGDFGALRLGDLADIQNEILAIEVPYDDGVDSGVVVLQNFSRASLVEFRFQYDEVTDTLLDTETGEQLVPDRGNFVRSDGSIITPGWSSSIGFSNFDRVFTSPAIRGPFLRVFVWNWAFAAGTVIFSFFVGLGLALTLDHPKMRGQRIYRALLIFPWALPSVLTVLVWEAMLNRQFGIINGLLGLDIGWLNSPGAARATVLFVSTWLSFPYFFVVSTGALQSIPAELTEAAYVDGANGQQAFSRVRFPLLLQTLAPLIISSFAFNFNNFNVVFFLTRGGPPVVGAQTPAGSTDILVSYTYQLAFASGRGQDLGFATAISILIFLHIAAFSAWGFRKTARLEDL